MTTATTTEATDLTGDVAPRRRAPRGIEAFAAMDCYGFALGYDYYGALYGADPEPTTSSHAERPAREPKEHRGFGRGLAAAASRLRRTLVFGAPAQPAR